MHPGYPRAQGVGRPRARGGREGHRVGTAAHRCARWVAPQGARQGPRPGLGQAGLAHPLGYPAGYAPRARDRAVMPVRQPGNKPNAGFFPPKGQVSAQTRWSQPR